MNRPIVRAVILGLSGIALTAAESHAGKISDMEQGAAFNKCINISDFVTKTADDTVGLADRDNTSGCCPEGYTAGAKHYDNYVGAQIICGFKADGKVATSSTSSNGVKTCTYNACYVMKNGHKCKDGTPMKLNGCCGADNKNTNYHDHCKMYSKSYTSMTTAKKTVNYCLSYNKKYKMEGTSNKTDDQVDGKLQVSNLYIYTPCTGGLDTTNATETVVAGPVKATGDDHDNHKHEKTTDSDATSTQAPPEADASEAASLFHFSPFLVAALGLATQ